MGFVARLRLNFLLPTAHYPAVSTTIHTHVFDNGLALVAEPSAGVESAAFTFLVPGGCCHDPTSRAGLASLACEMTIRGCGTRDGRAFINDLETLGIERGESVGLTLTSYSGATVHNHLNDALEIYADLIRRPLLPEDQLEAGQQVCLLELASIEDDPSHKLMLELRRQHYPDPWGRSSQGTAEDLRASTIDDVRQFHRTRFQPNGAILGVAGKIEWNAVVDLVGQLFGDWKPVETADPVEAPCLGGHTHLNAPSNQTQIGIAFPSIPYRHPDYFQAWGAVGVLSGGMSSRLFTEVRERRGLCYSIHASLNTQRDRAAVMCYAGTTAERAQETLDVTFHELVRLGRGIHTDELGRLKARIKSGLIMQQESTSARSGAIAREWHHLGLARTLDEIGGLVDALSSESINAYLKKHPPSDFTVVTMGPDPLETPSAVS